MEVRQYSVFYSKAGFLGSIYFKQKSVQSSSELQIKEDAHRQRGTSNPGHTGDLFIKKSHIRAVPHGHPSPKAF